MITITREYHGRREHAHAGAEYWHPVLKLHESEESAESQKTFVRFVEGDKKYMTEYNDSEIIEMLDAIYGAGNWKGIDTPAKRECWLYGYDNPTARTSMFSKPDSVYEEFKPISFGRTDNDAYYIMVGQLAYRLCRRCGHTFPAGRKLPKTCPNRVCRSPYWNKPRRDTKHGTDI